MISIEGLQAFADRLAGLDVGRTAAEALRQAAHNLAGSVNSKTASPPIEQSAPTRREHDAMPWAGASYRIGEHSAEIIVTDAALVEREVGSATNSPDPILSVAARQSAPAIAQRVGQVLSRLMSDVGFG